MTDIFISYANEDRERAAQVAQLLELEGWHVWWDRRIPAGRSWRSVLEDAVGDSRCMLVLWSKHSVKSPWVAEEAEEARRLEKTLMPVLIERVDPPLGFRAIQAANLIDWNGAPDDPAARLLIADLKSLLGQSVEKAEPEIRVIERPPPEPRRNMLDWLGQNASKAGFGAVVIIGVLAVWQLWPNFKPYFFAAAPSREAEHPDSAAVPRLTHLGVSADRQSIKPTETLKLSLMGQYSDGSQREVSDVVQWSSSDTRIATVDGGGEVRALQLGRTNIRAKVGNLESAEWTLRVETPSVAAKPAPPKLVALNVTSSKYEFTESERIALRAKGKFSDNSEKTLSDGVEWEISDRTIASVNQRGELVARRPGKIKVVARSDELTSSPITLLIKETRKTAEPPPKPTHPAEVPPAKPPVLSEQTKARIVAYLDRAQVFREQGNYAGALAELEKARAMDAANEEIRKEIEQTKRACNAEKVLGNKPNC